MAGTFFLFLLFLFFLLLDAYSSGKWNCTFGKVIGPDGMNSGLKEGAFRFKFLRNWFNNADSSMPSGDSSYFGASPILAEKLMLADSGRLTPALGVNIFCAFKDRGFLSKTCSESWGPEFGGVIYSIMS